MPLVPEALDKCFRLLRIIREQNISDIFERPVNPIDDNCPDYFEIIKKPTDLSTIERKLKQNQYNYVSEFKHEVELIFSNAVKYFDTHDPESPVKLIALELRSTYEKEAQFISDNPKLDWKNEFLSLLEDFSVYCKPLAPNCSIQKRSSSTKQIDQTSGDSEYEPAADFYDRDKLLDLANNIKSFSDKKSSSQLFDTLKENQPNAVGDDKRVNVNLFSLNVNTIESLYKAIEQLKSQEGTETESLKSFSSGEDDDDHLNLEGTS